MDSENVPVVENVLDVSVVIEGVGVSHRKNKYLSLTWTSNFLNITSKISQWQDFSLPFFFFTYTSERDIHKISKVLSQRIERNERPTYKTWCMKFWRNSVHPTFSTSFTSCDDIRFSWVRQKKAHHKLNPNKQNTHTEALPIKENNNGNT